jgi:hypothetical protein
MMPRRALEKLAQLSAGEFASLLQAVLALLAADVALRLFSFRAVQKFAASRFRPAPEGFEPNAQRLIWAVSVAGQRLGVLGSCLRQAVALQAMLGRRGVATTLWLGADRRSARPSFAAHAWLEDNAGKVLVGGPVDGERFERLSAFAAPESERRK